MDSTTPPLPAREVDGSPVTVEEAERAEPLRGRVARSPAQIPWAGWKDILRRVYQQIEEDNVFIVAGGVAFFAIGAIFPGLIALISLYGLFADPEVVERSLNALGTILPRDGYFVIQRQLHEIVGQSDAELGWGLVLSTATALWSASGGVRAVVTALNIAYDEEERRGFFHLYLLTFGFTLLAVLSAVILLALLAGLTTLLSGFHPAIAAAILWPLVLVGFSGILTVIYRYAPSRARARFQWVSWGSAFAAVAWAILSVGFALYAAKLGDYQETYGALGGVILLLMWLYITALVVLIGAELNAEIEAQTAVDSTTGSPLPMGKRGARKADTLGKLKPPSARPKTSTDPKASPAIETAPAHPGAPSSS